MPYLLGPAGAQSPPTRNEVLLREAVDRLRDQLDTAREENSVLRGRIQAYSVEGLRLENELRAAQEELATLGGDLHFSGYRRKKCEAQLDAARKVADQLAGVVYNHRQNCPCTRCEVLHAFDQLTKELPQ